MTRNASYSFISDDFFSFRWRLPRQRGMKSRKPIKVLSHQVHRKVNVRNMFTRNWISRALASDER